MARRFDYRQTCIGACGHVIIKWPARGTLGMRESDTLYLCEECTRTQVGVPDDTPIDVWIWVPEQQHKQKEPETRIAKPRKKAAPKVKKLSFWDELMLPDNDGG